MMGKIRFVASSLLDTLAVQSGDGNGNSLELPLRLQKAQNYLCEWLMQMMYDIKIRGG